MAQVFPCPNRLPEMRAFLLEFLVEPPCGRPSKLPRMLRRAPSWWPCLLIPVSGTWAHHFLLVSLRKWMRRSLKLLVRLQAGNAFRETWPRRLIHDCYVRALFSNWQAIRLRYLRITANYLLVPLSQYHDVQVRYPLHLILITSPYTILFYYITTIILKICIDFIQYSVDSSR